MALVRKVLSMPGETLLLGGDVFHNKTPTGATEYVFKKGMDILLERGHRVLFITGNHDDEDVPRSALFGAEHMEDGVVYEVNGMRVAGINYCRVDEKLQQSLANAPECDALVMHTGFRHLIGFADAWQCSEEDVPDHVGCVLVGHVHKAICKGKVHSAGATCVNSVDEFLPQDHGCIVLTKDEVKWEPLPGRLFRTLDLWPGLGEYLNTIVKRERTLPPVINLRYPEGKEAEVESIVEQYPGVHFIPNMVSGTLAENLEVTWQEGLAISEVIQQTVAELLPDMQERGLAMSLISSPDPVEVLEKFLEGLDATN